MDDLDAIRRITEALAGFDDTEKKRILRWVIERLNLGLRVIESYSGKEAVSDLEADPRQQFIAAHRAGRYSDIPAIAERLLDAGDTLGYIAAAVAMTDAGYGIGARMLVKASKLPSLGRDERRHIASQLSQYFNTSAKPVIDPDEAVTLLENYVHEGGSNEELAFFYNQLGRLQWGLNRFEDALQSQQKAIDLSPRDTAYIYNYALIARRLKRKEPLSAFAEKLLRSGDADSDHLELAKEIFAAEGQKRLLEEAKLRAAELLARRNRMKQESQDE